MSTTVLDALRGGLINLENLGRFGLAGNPIYMIAHDQIENGIKALENGKGIHDVIQEDMFGDVDVGEKKGEEAADAAPTE